MKRRVLLPLFGLLSLALPHAFAEESAPARLNLLQVKVDVENVDRERSDNTTSQTKRLKITLENRNKEEVTGKIEWKLVGKNLESRDLVAMGGAEIDYKLAPGQTKDFETPSVTFTEKKAKRSNNKNAKKTPDTGEDYKGYFVEVEDKDGKLVGSAYSPGMKEGAKDLFVQPGKKH